MEIASLRKAEGKKGLVTELHFNLSENRNVAIPVLL
jgi:hypothetical protein